MSIISFVRSLFSPKVSAEKSELSNPDIHIPPYGFYAPHYRVLEYISNHFLVIISSDDIKYFEKSADKRASELWKMWFLNVRVEKFPLPQGGTGKRNYYSINKKGKEALVNFNHKF